MFSFFEKKKTTFFSPVSGTIIPLSKIQDPVFSKGMMGPGFGIDSIEKEIYSPIEGVVTNIFPTKHAISIRTRDKKEILLHIGIDTVELQGKGFEMFIENNSRVTKETLLVRIDRDYLKKQNKLDTLIVLFPEEKKLPIINEREVMVHETIFNFV